MKRPSYQDYDYAFGQIMLSLRSAMGITQAELGKVLGISRRSVADWEAGSKYPKVEHLKALIVLAVQQQAFQTGREEEEIRALWKAARQKVLLDKGWLAGLIRPDEKNASYTIPTSATLPIENSRRRQPPLPIPPTQFIGRIAEVAEIMHILSSGSRRLLTLLGPGGIGKTRLALEIASRMMNRFSNGVVFVGLAPIGSPNQIVSTIGEALEWGFTGQSDPTLYLLDYLREQHLLLILDNFEHLLAGVHLVSDILKAAPDVIILATSRERLNLQAEWLFDVEGLSYPSDTSTTYNLSDLSDYSAIELFVQRALQIQPRFRLVQSNFMTILRICQHLAGMPLAIELAAANARVLTVFQIELQIRTNLDALTSSLHDMPMRHRSMRAVFDQSWNLLNPAEQMVFRRLAVFRAGFGLDAASQVANATLPTLTTLVDKSLVRQEETPVVLSNSSEIEEARFQLLEPIREYAFEKLMAGGEFEAVQHAHAIYYLSVAEAASAKWYDAKPAWEIKRLSLELDNFRAALQWARDGGDLTIGSQLASALARFWRILGYISEGRVWLAELLAHDDPNSDLPTQAARSNALHAAALLAADQHDFAQAEALIEQRMALRRNLGENEDETDLHTNMALQARVLGDYARATRLLQTAVERYRASGNRGSLSTGGLGFSIYFLALVLREQGNFEQAETLFKTCVDFHAEIGERTGVAQGLLGLSDVARDRGDVVQTRVYCEQSLVIYREFGTQWAIGFALNNLAQASYLDGDLHAALFLANESVSLFRSLQADGGVAEVLVTLGQILREQRQYESAQTALSEALRLAWVVGPRLMMVNGLEALASVMAQSAREKLAVQALSLASRLRLAMGTPVRPADQPILEQTLAMLRSSFDATTFESLWLMADEKFIQQFLLGQ
jgi:predicted ATPase/transcriptional regulator with XRE-family HTH domain